MIMNAENDRYHIPPQKAAEGAGQKDETHLRVVFYYSARRLFYNTEMSRLF